MTQLLSDDAAGTGAAAPRAERIVLVRPLPGLPGAREFALEPLPERFFPFARLVARDRPGLELLVVPPGHLFPDYVIEVPDLEAEALGVAEPGEVRVLVLVTHGRSTPPTANLMGPLVVSNLDGRALQLVLEDGRYGVAVPLEAGSARPSPSSAPSGG